MPTTIFPEIESLSKTTYRLGQIYWRQFSQTPLGLMTQLILPDEAVRERGEYLFMVGFGERVFDNLCDLNPTETLPERFERSWRAYLDRAVGKVLLDGPPYPATPPKWLDMAEALYRIGHLRADILLDEMAAG